MATKSAGANFQRVGSISNAHVGREFEAGVRSFFAEQGFPVVPDFRIPVGHGNRTKLRAFDLGCREPPILVECKSHRWTAGNNIPSAKMTVWNEAMYYFALAPAHFRKCLCVLHDKRTGSGISLAEYYLKNYGHLVPDAVEIWEFDPAANFVGRAC